MAEDGKTYLDFYGGHGVISIGHCHPQQVKRLNEQQSRLIFYSNSVDLPGQEQLAKSLATISGYPDHRLFLCNSGAEANDNALKIAAFATGKSRIASFQRGFHGRTVACLNVSDYPTLLPESLRSLANPLILESSDPEQVERQLVEAGFVEDGAAIILEPIQGVGGVFEPSHSLITRLQDLRERWGFKLIADEVQSGFARSGDFFAHTALGLKADLISMAKGMGNGFPVGGVLVAPSIAAHKGMLGSTFGGAPLATVATQTVLDVIQEENLLENVRIQSQRLRDGLAALPGLKPLRGRGLMLGIEPVASHAAKSIRQSLLHKHHIFTGFSGQAHTIRLLPPLNVSGEEVDRFLNALQQELQAL